MLVERALWSPRFVPAIVAPDVAAAAMPVEVPKSRIEVALRCNRRIIFEDGVDMDALLKLSRGLEALK